MSKSVVYGVSHGEYSAHEILAVFDTREKATAYIDRFKHHCWRCDTYSQITPVGTDETKCPKCGEGILWRGDLEIEEFSFNPESESE